MPIFVNDIAPYVMCTQRECFRIWTIHFDNCTSAGRHDLAGVSQDVLQMAAVDKEWMNCGMQFKVHQRGIFGSQKLLCSHVEVVARWSRGMIFA